MAIRSTCSAGNGGINNTPVTQQVNSLLAAYSTFSVSGCSGISAPTDLSTDSPASSTSPPTSPTASSTPTGAAPRETGCVVAAAAMMVAGVVAAL